MIPITRLCNDKVKRTIVSISWGLCEAYSGAAELQTLDTIFKQGAAQGISFFAAAGDSGAYDCGDGNLGVDSPASDPYVTGVGGTNLQLNAGAYGSESVWSNPSDTQRSPNGAGGGGGVSNTFAQPSWQTGPGQRKVGTAKFQMYLRMLIQRRDMQRIVQSQMQVVLQRAGLLLVVRVRQRHYGQVAWH